MATYNFVIDSSFRPYSFEERVKPYLLYKDAYDKAEAVYDELSDKADTFSYLADKLGDDPNNKAAQIYKGYADELQRQADDFARNGLTMANRRALGNLKRRYQGEIGQLVRADERMKEVQKKRDALQAAGKQMFYGVNNLDINDFLGDGSQFNGYAIDAEDLRKEAADYAKNVSSSLYDSDLVESTNKHFLKEIEKYGRDPEILAAWRSDLESIPEFQNAVDDIVRARGIDTNLKGADYDSAVQTIINGVMEGAVSKTTHKYVSNPDELTKDQELDNARADAADKRAQEKWDREKEEDDIRRSIMYKQNPNGTWSLNPEYVGGNYEVDPNTGKLKKKPATEKTPEEKAAEEAAKEEKSRMEARQKGLMDKDTQGRNLAHDGGFDVNVGNDRLHYTYIGAVSHHKGKGWQHGALGEDVPHRGFDWTSSSNLMSWGNFSAEGMDDNAKKNMRIVAPSEMVSILADPELGKAIKEQAASRRILLPQIYEDMLKKNNGDQAATLEEINKEQWIIPNDVVLVQVPDENNKRNGYLIAVQ